MDALFRKSDRLLANTRTDIIRDKMDDIHWNAQLISIMGAKGVGKSLALRESVMELFIEQKVDHENRPQFSKITKNYIQI